MLPNKPTHITYIGRLESEKGIEIVLSCITKGVEEMRNVVWHICGDGSYMEQFIKLEKYEKLDIRIYGHIDRRKLDEVLAMTDLVLMPSLFLETFGLVALETLSGGVPVCGFADGGLLDFIHPSLILDRVDPITSFFRILDIGEFPILDISSFSRDLWIERLRDLTQGSHTIFLINDYTGIVGGAEQYIQDLTLSLQSIGKKVEVFGYPKKVNRWMRIWLMCLTPVAFWRGIYLSQKIKKSQPDLIWMHSVLRYIGPYGLRAVANSQYKKYITHHDLGLITLRPSQVYALSDIPVSPSLGDWIPQKINIFSVISTGVKWLYISWIWHILNSSYTDGKSESSGILHILPSRWMQPYFQKYIQDTSIIFPHTSKSSEPVKH